MAGVGDGEVWYRFMTELERQAQTANMTRLDRSTLLVETIRKLHNGGLHTTILNKPACFGDMSVRELARFYVERVLTHSPRTIVVQDQEWLNHLNVDRNVILVAYHLYRERVEPANDDDVKAAHAALWKWWNENEAELCRL